MSGIIILHSCDDFLNVKPRNTRIVKTVKDYRDILASYMAWIKGINERERSVMGSWYNYPNFDLSDVCGLYTGEIELKSESIIDPSSGTIAPYAKTVLSWTKKTVYTWSQNYKFTGPLNYIIDNIGEAQTEGDDIEGKYENMKNYIKGEALVWRAFTYYKTLQYYSPYKNNKLGIPVNTKAYKDPVHTAIKRNTQKEVYEQIVSDCNQALDLLKKTPQDSWNFAYNEDFIHAMLANIYMYKAMSGAKETTDWSNAIAYAEKAIKNRTLTNNPSILMEMFNINKNTGFNLLNSDEFFIRIIKKYSFDFPESGYAGSTFSVNTANPEIYKMYRNNDIRKDVYFKDLSSDISTNIINNKYSMYGGKPQDGGVFMPFRLADMYLIKAEALLRDNKPGAKEILDEFKQSRYINPEPSPSSTEELLKEVLKERRLEFFQENDKRWIDMKRLGIKFDRGEIAGSKFVLESNDFRYSFPIPLSELKEESDIVQNPGWDSILSND